MGARELTCILAVALLQRTSAQEVLWQRVGVGDQVWIGGQGVFVGDVDGDGYADVVTMAWHYFTGPPRYETGNLLLSGKDGHTIDGNLCPDRDNYAYSGYIAAAGDVDGDGLGDFVRLRIWSSGGPTRPNVIEVRSARAGLPLLHEVTGPRDGLYGQPLVGNIDLNGDGRPDLLAASPRELPQNGKDWSVLYGYDHRGTLLFRKTALSIREGPQGLDRVGDVDNDRCDDFVVGGWESGTGTRSGAFVYSGRTQGLLTAAYERSPGEPLSFAAGGCGDIDGDGIPDFWGAAPAEWPRTNPGVVRVFSGATGQDIHAWVWPPQSGFGQWIDSADLDLDGVPDFLITTSAAVSGTQAGGQVFYFSGRDGSLVTKIGPPDLPPTWTWFGYRATVGPPQPGNPFPVFAVSEIDYGFGGTVNRLGRLTLFRSVPSGVRAAGTPCAGTLPQAPRIGYRPVVEHGGGRIHLTHAPPGTYAVLLVGLSNANYAGYALPLGLDALGFRGCLLLNSIDAALLTRTGTQGNDSGYASCDVPRWPGVPLYAQWLVLGAGSLAPGGLSDGMVW